MKKMFQGSIVALVTPFKDGRVDEPRLRALVDFHVKNGTDAIVPCGTTGESPALSHDEHKRVVEIVVEAAAGRLPVIAGTGSNSTAEAIDLTLHAKKAGADGALLVCPYYNKPTQKGLIEHYRAIADRVDLPGIIYNIPGRTASRIEVATMARLAIHRNIAGVKDAVGDLNYTSELIARLGPTFYVLSGDDSLTIPMMALGARGVISVAANVVPSKISGMVAAMGDGEIVKARAAHFELWDLVNAMFYETNPIPVKNAPSVIGKTT